MNKVSDFDGSTSAGVNKWICMFFGLLILFTLTTVALAGVILSVVVNRLDPKNTLTLTTSPTLTPTPSPTTSSNTNGPSSNTTVPSSNTTGPLSLVDQIKIDDLMTHLGELQIIADRSNGTRAIATGGFNGTLDYITRQLQHNTNLIVQHQYFTVRNYIVQGTPQLQSRINGNNISQVYLTDFAHILFSSRANFDSFVQVVAIPNLGCQDADWTSVSVAGLVALVKRGDCTYPVKSALAEKYGVRGLLIYNDGTASGGLQPIQGVRNNLNTTIPAFFLSYNLGMQLANSTANAAVIMTIDVSDANGIGNICADTPTGDKTKTIVVGSHSDGVPAGSGINDNGKKLPIYC
jgi:hypothetical protein